MRVSLAALELLSGLAQLECEYLGEVGGGVGSGGWGAAAGCARGGGGCPAGGGGGGARGRVEIGPVSHPRPL